MVYNQKFVVIVKSGNKVLREKGDTVYIPFGEEYSIVLKNLNSVKAVAKITVDGEDTLDGNGIIVPANSTVELEGFMKGKKVTNKFKFIEKTDQIAAYRGNKIGDGLVRVSFKFEVPLPIVTYPSTMWYTDNRGFSSGRDIDYGSFCTGDHNSFRLNSMASSFGQCYSKSMRNEDGITVKGSLSNQSFTQGVVGILEAEEHVIVLQLKGSIKNKIVQKAVSVKTKLICEICGKSNKSSSKFCSNCGAYLL